MITLMLEQTNPDADSTPDGLMQQYTDETIAEFKDMGSATRIIGNEDMLAFFRVAVKEQRIKPDELIILVGKNRITIDTCGNLDGHYDTDRSWEAAMMKLF